MPRRKPPVFTAAELKGAAERLRRGTLPLESHRILVQIDRLLRLIGVEPHSRRELHAELRRALLQRQRERAARAAG